MTAPIDLDGFDSLYRYLRLHNAAQRQQIIERLAAAAHGQAIRFVHARVDRDEASRVAAVSLFTDDKVIVVDVEVPYESFESLSVRPARTFLLSQVARRHPTEDGWGVEVDRGPVIRHLHAAADTEVWPEEYWDVADSLHGPEAFAVVVAQDLDAACEGGMVVTFGDLAAVRRSVEAS